MDQQTSPAIKGPASFEEQLQIMKSRGLIIEDEDFAIRALQRINYYRLSAYGLSLKRNDQFFQGSKVGSNASLIYVIYALIMDEYIIVR